MTAGSVAIRGSLLTRIFAALAMLAVYVVGTLGVTTVMSFSGATPAQARGRRGRGRRGRGRRGRRGRRGGGVFLDLGIVGCSAVSAGCAESYGYRTRRWYRCMARNGC